MSEPWNKRDEYDDPSELVRRAAYAINRLPHSATPVEQARAALEAIREPTADMLMPGEMAVFESQRAERRWIEREKAKHGGLPSWVSTHATAAWKAMLAAALGEGGA